MDLYTFFLENDFVVKTMIVAAIVTFVIVLEKIYIFIEMFFLLRALKKYTVLDEIENLKDSKLKTFLNDLLDFPRENKELFHAFVGVTLDKYEAYLMQYISVLGLIAILSPMVGLIGTFLGVWHLFDGLSLVNLSDPSVIAKGIKEVLVDTMAGLGMAVIAMVFYKTFELYVHKSVIEFEEKLYRLL